MSSMFTQIKQFILLGRLHFVIAGFFLYSFGSLLALTTSASFSTIKFVLGYAIFFCAHLSVSYSNAYYDQHTDSLSQPTFFSGGSKVLVHHPHLAQIARIFAITLIICSLALSFIYLMIYPQQPAIVLFAVAGNLLGWFYTAPPLQLAYRGLGELTVILSISLISTGMGYYVITGTLSTPYLLFIIPLIFYAFAFIISVEIPDRIPDQHTQKQTLIARTTESTGFFLNAFFLCLSSIYFALLNLLPTTFTSFSIAPFFFFSLLPTGTSLLAFLLYKQHLRPITPAMITIASIALMILFSDLYLLIFL